MMPATLDLTQQFLDDYKQLKLEHQQLQDDWASLSREHADVVDQLARLTEEGTPARADPSDVVEEPQVDTTALVDAKMQIETLNSQLSKLREEREELRRDNKKSLVQVSELTRERDELNRQHVASELANQQSTDGAGTAVDEEEVERLRQQRDNLKDAVHEKERDITRLRKLNLALEKKLYDLENGAA